MMLWSGGRNYYLAEWGEYEPCSGWTFNRCLMRSATTVYSSYNWSGIAPSVQVWARLRVSERSKKAYRFHLSVTTNGKAALEHAGRCRSCKDALRKANGWLSDSDRVRAALQRWYSENNAELILREGAEFLALFDWDYMILPLGEFRTRQSIIRRWPSGFSTESDKL